MHAHDARRGGYLIRLPGGWLRGTDRSGRPLVVEDPDHAAHLPTWETATAVARASGVGAVAVVLRAEPDADG